MNTDEPVMLTNAHIEWERIGSRYGGKTELGPLAINLDLIEVQASKEVEEYLQVPWKVEVEVTVRLTGADNANFQLGRGTIKNESGKSSDVTERQI